MDGLRASQESLSSFLSGRASFSLSHLPDILKVVFAFGVCEDISQLSHSRSESGYSSKTQMCSLVDESLA